MKKVFPVLILGSLLVGLFLPMLTFAQEVPACCKMRTGISIDDVTANKGAIVGLTAGDTSCPLGTTSFGSAKWGMYCLLSTIYTIVDWIFILLIAVATILVIIGAFTIMTAAGSPEKVSKGRDYIMYAAVGLVVALLSRAVPSLVKAVLGY